MKSFKDYLSEETMPQALADKEFVGVESEAVRDNINNLIKGVTAKPFVTPYIALERVRKVLAYFHISLPAHNFMQGDYGYSIFNINQFGAKFGQTNDGDVVVKEDSPYSVYFEYQAGDDGLYDVFCELVTDDELEEILADYDAESEDNEENEEEYGTNAQQNYEINKDEHEGLKEENINEVGDSEKGKRAINAVGFRADGEIVDQAMKSRPNKKKLNKALRGMSLALNANERRGGKVLNSYLKRSYGVQEETINEGRPSQRHPLEGHPYHKKSDAELIYIAKDAHKAAEAMKGHNTEAENKYADQANDSATVRYWRKKNGMPNWYKKKYGHDNAKKEALDEVSKDTVPFDSPTEKPSTPYKNPDAKAKQLARAAMRQVLKGKEEKKRLRKSLREK